MFAPPPPDICIPPSNYSETNSKLAEVPGVAPENLNKKSNI